MGVRRYLRGWGRSDYTTVGVYGGRSFDGRRFDGRIICWPYYMMVDLSTDRRAPLREHFGGTYRWCPEIAESLEVADSITANSDGRARGPEMHELAVLRVLELGANGEVEAMACCKING